MAWISGFGICGTSGAISSVEYPAWCHFMIMSTRIFFVFTGSPFLCFSFVFVGSRVPRADGFFEVVVSGDDEDALAVSALDAPDGAGRVE